MFHKPVAYILYMALYLSKFFLCESTTVFIGFSVMTNSTNNQAYSLVLCSVLLQLRILLMFSIAPDNVDAWLNAGAKVVGLGANLVGKDINFPVRHRHCHVLDGRYWRSLALFCRTAQQSTTLPIKSGKKRDENQPDKCSAKQPHVHCELETAS